MTKTFKEALDVFEELAKDLQHIKTENSWSAELAIENQNTSLMEKELEKARTDLISMFSNKTPDSNCKICRNKRIVCAGCNGTINSDDEDPLCSHCF